MRSFGSSSYLTLLVFWVSGGCGFTDNIMHFDDKEKVSQAFLRFRNDVWVASQCFNVSFPRYYTLALDKDCSHNKWSVSSLSNFNLWMRIPFLGREVEELTTLNNLIQNDSLFDGCDGWVWSMDAKGEFSVA